MRKSSKIVAVLAIGGLSAASALSPGGTAAADAGWRLNPVPHANVKSPGLTTPNVLSPGLSEIARAQGSMVVENPQDGIGYYGYDSVDNSPSLLPVVGPGGTFTEAHKTEPDKNTYLVLHHQRGADSGYDYGSHFLFQGHEAGTPGYVTRINLDADAAHRVTILATRDATGRPLPAFDGSTWNPFTRQLLMTSEAGCAGGVWAGSAAYRPGSRFAELPALGKGGYEGVQTASDGSVWLVEDVGGAVPAGTNGKLANSFVYRFVPRHKGDLTRGTLQALQVLRADGTPMDTSSSLLNPDIKALNSYVTQFRTRWVDLHTTTRGNLSETFCAGDAAKAAKATPFKRPENGVFRPGTQFGEFFFTETGDTNALSQANNGYGGYGGYGGIFRLRQNGPSASRGTLTLFARGDLQHTGFDNIAFAGARQLVVVEDAGDGLHTQRNALDSAYLYRVSGDFDDAPTPVRVLAEGRDPSATIDSALGDAKTPGFVNDGDNEITGIHISDGDATAAGLLGAKVPRPFTRGWRVFWTQQHGDNVTWEVIPDPARSTR
jgi:hypothetical protein